MSVMDERDLYEKIYDYLARNQVATDEDISKVFNVDADVVRKYINRMSDRKHIEILDLYRRPRVIITVTDGIETDRLDAKSFRRKMLKDIAVSYFEEDFKKCENFSEREKIVSEIKNIMIDMCR